MLENQEYFEDTHHSAERRAHARVMVSSLAYIELDQDHGGLIINVSEGGLAIQATDFPAGRVFPNMHFRLPKSPKWIEATGRLVWKGSQNGAGIKFIEMSEDVRLQIQSWIDSAALSLGHHVGKGRFKIIWEPEELKPGAQDSSGGDAPSQFDSMFPSEKSLPRAKRVSPDFGPSAASSLKVASRVDEARKNSVGMVFSGGVDSSVGAGAAKEIEKVPETPQHSLSEPANIQNLRAALRSPESTAKKPVSSETQAGECTITGFGYQPTPLEGPSKNGLIVVNAILLILVATGGVMAMGPANLKDMLLHHAFSKIARVAGPPQPENKSETAKDSAPAMGSSLPHFSAAEPVPLSETNALENETPTAGTLDAEPATPEVAKGASTKTPTYSRHSETAESTEDEVRQFQLKHSANNAAIIHPLPASPVADTGSPRQQQAVLSARTQGTQDNYEHLKPTNSSIDDVRRSSQSQSEDPAGTVAISSHFLSIGAETRPDSVLQIGKLASFRQPSMPIEATREQAEGTVILRVMVTLTGAVGRVYLISGPPPLVPAAIDAVRQWRYEPTMLDGRAVETVDEVTILFRLGNTASVSR